MIKAVICDLGNVLAFFNRSITYKKLSCRLNLSQREIQGKFENSSLMEEYELGRISCQQFHQSFLEVLDRAGEIEFDEFSRIYGDMFTPNSLLIDILARLREQKLVMLSNTCQIHFDFINNNFPEITKLFEDRLVLSFREGRAKPHRENFIKALELAECSPCEALFIDDIEKYTKAAAELGLHTLTYWPGAVISPSVIERFYCKCSMANHKHHQD